jgi:signal transduction histidine kinase
MFGRWKSVGDIWLVIAIIVFVPAALFGGIRTFSDMNTLLHNYRTGTWTVVEAQEEFHMVQLALADFRLQPDAATLDKLKLRFDVFWSRIPIILESSESAGVRRIPKIEANTRQIFDTLPVLEQELSAARPSDAQSIEPFRKTMNLLERPLEEMVQLLLVQDEMRYRARELSHGIWMTVGAFALAILAGIALIIGNLLKTQRVRQLYEQHRATEQERATQLAAIESSGEGIAIFDQRGRLHYSNEAFHVLIGDDYARDLTHMAWDRFLNRRSVAAIARHFRGHTTPWRGEVTGRTLAGEDRAWEVHVMARQEGGHIALLRDLSDRRKAEQQRAVLLESLHQADKMSSIGRIAGGVAHDFNNILAAISGFTALLEIDLGDSPKQRHMLQQIAAAATRGKDLVQSIMTFSRAEQAERHPIDAGDICREAATMVGVSISGPATFDIDIEEGPLPILGNLTQIDSAVVNLCINALDALDAGRGKVRLEVRRVHIDGGRLSGMKGNAILSPAEAPVVVEQAGANRTRMLVGLLGDAPSDHLRIRVVDDGSGMSEDVMRHMFEPFFTTKNVGQGTGLGLSSVLGIVSAHGGAIAVESTLGKGTVFDLLLPLLPAQEGTRTAAPAASSQQWPYGGLQILLVDDDPQAREALDLTLQSLGCETAACDSGEEALALVHDEPGLFDLVISDYLMPNMNGIELAARLRDLGFHKPIIITSGRVQDISMTDRARLNIEGLLPKPYSLREVGELVGRVVKLKRGPLGDPTPLQVTPLPPRKALGA